MPRRMKDPEPPDEPDEVEEEHTHDLRPHCAPPAACRWVSCKTCGWYADLDTKRWAYR